MPFGVFPFVQELINRPRFGFREQVGEGIAKGFQAVKHRVVAVFFQGKINRRRAIAQVAEVLPNRPVSASHVVEIGGIVGVIRRGAGIEFVQAGHRQQAGNVGILTAQFSRDLLQGVGGEIVNFDGKNQNFCPTIRLLQLAN